MPVVFPEGYNIQNCSLVTEEAFLAEREHVVLNERLLNIGFKEDVKDDLFFNELEVSLALLWVFCYWFRLL